MLHINILVCLFECHCFEEEYCQNDHDWVTCAETPISGGHGPMAITSL